MHRIPRLLCTLLIAVLTAPIGFAEVLPHPTDKFDRSHLPVFDSRVFRVPEPTQDRALRFLGDKDFRFASPQILKDLFGDRLFDTKEMLAAQAAAATKYAAKREEESKNPAFGEARVWMAADAKAHRELAAYTETLLSELRPYLVKAQVYFERTGGFDVVLNDKLLKVQHSCLGRSTPPKKAVAILVFL